MPCRYSLIQKVITISLVVYFKELVAQEKDELDFEKYPNYGIDWIYFPDGDGNLQIGFLISKDMEDEELLREEGSNRVLNWGELNKDVTFTLYTANNTNTGELIAPNPESISKSSFSPNRPSKFVIHGWLSSGKSDTCQGIKNEYLKTHDYNVFIIDWSPIASNYYYTVPMSNTKKVGQYYADLLGELIKYGARASDIHLIGHSLGAHISSFAAEAVNNRTIGRVTALDPAQPGFNMGLLPGGKLSKNAANFVDVIHTCGGALGLLEHLGHADFYPNGGSFFQPGCGDVNGVMQGCSHGRSWQFFKESINGEPFIAKNCPSYNEFLADNCSDDFMIMGEGAKSTASGNYYLKTAPLSPFARLSK